MILKNYEINFENINSLCFHLPCLPFQGGRQDKYRKFLTGTMHDVLRKKKSFN